MIYLDHAATSWPKPPEVRERLLASLDTLTANAGRSGHRPSLASARLVFDVRTRWAALLGISAAEDLVFARGCTEAINLVLKGFLQPGQRVLVSPMEHNSVMRPLERLRRERQIAVETLNADRVGRLDLDDLRRAVRDRPAALACIQHASNVNGVVQDLDAVRAALGETPLLVDAAQTAGVLPIDVERLGIDFLACSAHKGMLALTGVGACYLAPQHEVEPLLEGGTGSRSESVEHPSFRPDRYEAGTLNLHGLAAMVGALESLAVRGLLGESKRAFCRRLAEGLGQMPHVRLLSPTDGSALCVAFTVEGLSPEIVSQRLEREHGVLCRPGLACAAAAHRHLGTLPGGVVRLSPGWGNTDEEMEATVAAVRAVAN